jgi:hypothetical protein
MLTESEKIEIINKTIKFEGGFGIDNNGGWVYCGINSNSNPTWPGWDIIEPLVKRKRFENTPNNWPRTSGVWNKIWSDPILQRHVASLASNSYYWNTNFNNCIDKRVASNFYDQRYMGGLEDILECVYNTRNIAQGVNMANADGDRALPRIIECRKQRAVNIKYRQTTAKGIKNVELGWEHYRKAALKRIEELNANWIGTGSSVSYPNTGNNNQNYKNIANEVDPVMDQQNYFNACPI